MYAAQWEKYKLKYFAVALTSSFVRLVSFPTVTHLFYGLFKYQFNLFHIIMKMEIHI